MISQQWKEGLLERPVIGVNQGVISSPHIRKRDQRPMGEGRGQIFRVHGRSERNEINPSNRANQGHELSQHLLDLKRTVIGKNWSIRC